MPFGTKGMVITMNSRERILTSISHKQPDRVPVDLGATPSSGISALAYSNLLKYLKIDIKPKIYDVVQQVAEPDDVIIDKFGVDVLDVGRSFNTDPKKWYDITLQNGELAMYPLWFNPVMNGKGGYDGYKNNEIIARMPQGATFFDQTCFPYEDGYPDNYKNLDKDMGKVIWSAFVHSPWDSVGEDGFWEKLRSNAIEMKNNSDKALMIVCGCNLFEWGTFLRRMDNFLMDIYTEPQEVDRLLEALMEVHMQTLENVCKYVGDVVDIIRFGDDLGMDSGSFMSPEKYIEHFKPKHTQLCDYVKKNSKMKTFLHSCGSIYKLMPHLIEAGYDIINPVQTNCVDMEADKLKKEFGKDITFWGGGANTREILNRGTAQQVKDDVKRRLSILMQDGGYVFNPIHNIMPDVPPENIVAMFEAVAEFDL